MNNIIWIVGVVVIVLFSCGSNASAALGRQALAVIVSGDFDYARGQV